MAVFTFPLYHGDRRLGALDLYRETPGELTPESLAAAQTLADVVAAYLLNAQARQDLQDSSDRSRQASLHDALTGLPNRVLLLERLVHARQRSRRTHSATGVYFIDLDLFKAVNDTHGHDIGDELLIAVAARLTGLLRPPDTLARLSGDEYVALCEDLADPDQAAAIGDPDDRRAEPPVPPDRGGSDRHRQHRHRLRRPGRRSHPGAAAARRGHGACTRPNTRAEHVSSSSTRGNSASPTGRPAWNATCTTRCNAGSCTWNTSPSWPPPTGGSPDSRRCCGGGTRPAAWSRRPRSSPWPNNRP